MEALITLPPFQIELPECGFLVEPVYFYHGFSGNWGPLIEKGGRKIMIMYEIIEGAEIEKVYSDTRPSRATQQT